MVGSAFTIRVSSVIVLFPSLESGTLKSTRTNTVFPCELRVQSTPYGHAVRFGVGSHAEFVHSSAS